MVDHLRYLPDWPRDNLPSGSKVLIHDAGLIAVKTDLRLTDVVGLKSPSSVAALRRHPGDRAAALSEIARGHHYLVELPNWNLAEELRSRGGVRSKSTRSKPTSRSTGSRRRASAGDQRTDGSSGSPSFL